MSDFEGLPFFQSNMNLVTCLLPLGGAKGQSLPILDWMLMNKHIWVWKFLGGKKIKNRHSLSQKKCGKYFSPFCFAWLMFKF